MEGVIFALFQCEEIAAGKISFNLKNKSYFQVFEMKAEMGKLWITPQLLCTYTPEM